MALAYEISPAGEYVRVIGSGEITTVECIRMAKRILFDSRRRPDSAALVDLRNATYAPKDQTEIIHIAKAVEMFQFMLRNNIAIVVNQPLIFPTEILATYIRKVTHLGIRVFVDLAAAMDYCTAGCQCLDKTIRTG